MHYGPVYLRSFVDGKTTGAILQTRVKSEIGNRKKGNYWLIYYNSIPICLIK